MSTTKYKITQTGGQLQADLNKVEVMPNNVQEKLVTGTNIKRVNNIDLLGAGNVNIQGMKIIEILSSSGTLTTEQYDLLGPDAIIKYSGEYYFCYSYINSVYIFHKFNVDVVATNASKNITIGEITITSNKAYTVNPAVSAVLPATNSTNKVLTSTNTAGVESWSDLKTINGQSIIGIGNISISAGRLDRGYYIYDSSVDSYIYSSFLPANYTGMAINVALNNIIYFENWNAGTRIGYIAVSPDSILASKTIDNELFTSELTAEHLTFNNVSLETLYQRALTTSSVTDGTIEKAIGFDSNGALVKSTSSVGDNQTITAKLNGTNVSFNDNAVVELKAGNNITITPDTTDNTITIASTGGGGSGTVTSVSAGTGLSISGTATIDPTINIDTGYKLPTTLEWDGKQDALPAVTSSDKDKFLHTNATSGDLEWAVAGGSTNIIQDLTTNVAGAVSAADWTSLKVNHAFNISSPVMTGLDSTYAFVDIKLNINSVNQIVKISKNTNNKYSGLFFIEESTHLFEISVYYNGVNIILRCATVY